MRAERTGVEGAARDSTPDAVPAPGRAAVMVPCTCGELVQGVVDGGHFLVSCPIDRFARVEATLAPGTGRARGPADRPKALAAARATLNLLGAAGWDVRLRVSNPVPAKRGYGSSTADVVGAIEATAGALGEWLSPPVVARLAIGVEPSDSVMFPGLALLDHRGGERWEELGPPPPLLVVVLDFGGGVDTLSFNANLNRGRLRELEDEHRRALHLLRRGVESGDPALVGAAATSSALANQAVLPKPYLPAAVALAEEAGAFGVCAAHSGTALGILAPPGGAAAVALLGEARARLPGLVGGWISRLVGGGVRPETPFEGTA